LLIAGLGLGPRRDARANHVDVRAVAVEIWADGCDTTPNHGSGVAVGHDLVATVAHLVAGAATLRVVDDRQRSHRGEIVAIDTERDVAIVRVDAFDRRRLPLRPLVAGARGAFYGFGGETPVLAPFTVVKAASIVSEDIYIRGEHPRPGYQLAADVVAGDSGAGLITDDGALGGVVWATSETTKDRGFAIGASVITDVLAAVGTTNAASVPCA
jgi:S1-C subfamily serine protease